MNSLRAVNKTWMTKIMVLSLTPLVTSNSIISAPKYLSRNAHTLHETKKNKIGLKD